MTDQDERTIDMEAFAAIAMHIAACAPCRARVCSLIGTDEAAALVPVLSLAMRRFLEDAAPNVALSVQLYGLSSLVATGEPDSATWDEFLDDVIRRVRGFATALRSHYAAEAREVANARDARKAPGWGHRMRVKRRP